MRVTSGMVQVRKFHVRLDRIVEHVCIQDPEAGNMGSFLPISSCGNKSSLGDNSQNRGLPNFFPYRGWL